jgi:GTPase
MPKMITIIGEKEVGKTTLFRRITKKYSATFNKKPVPMVNYVEEVIDIEGNNNYKLIDTPQFFLSSQTEIEEARKNQLIELLKKSDLVLWVIDKITENTLLINKYLKKFKVPKFLLLNKIDLVEPGENFSSYQSLQSEYQFFISALQGIGLDNLTAKIISFLPSLHQEKIASSNKGLNLLIFGAPNSGKSTLMNYLLQENRSVVSPVAGTTQEPVTSSWNWKKINFQLIDTAGITKEQKLKRDLWRRCDLAWVVIDASLPLTKQIYQIVNLGEKHNKPLIIIVNKCDLISEKEAVIEELRNRLKSLSYCPIICLSALKGKGINLLVRVLGEMIKQSQKTFTKKEIEVIIEKMVANNPPKFYQGGKLKIYFAKHEPGLVHFFIFFVNNPQWTHFSYQRYMVNYLRKYLKLEYLPVKVIFKKSV